MPQITLDVVSLDAAPLPVARSYRFDGDGGTIGRDETNALVLPDKHRRVSRLHAAVTFPAGVPTITNASTSLPISLGEVPLDCGQTLPLSSGDILEIGPYILKVQTVVLSDIETQSRAVPSADPASALKPVVTEVFVQAPLPTPEPVRATPVAVQSSVAVAPMALLPAADDADPFASLLAGIGSVAPPMIAQPSPVQPPNDFGVAPVNISSPSAAAPRAAEVSGLSVDPLAALGFGEVPTARSPGPFIASAELSPTAAIPEDFNPFDLPSGTARNSADPFSSLLGVEPASPAMRGAEASIDSLFATPGSTGFDGLISGPTSAGSPQPGLDLLLASSGSSDPLALFGDVACGRDSLLQPVRDDLAEISGAFQPPRAIQPAAPTAPAAYQVPVQGKALSAAAVPATVFPVDALTQAFLDGTKLPAGVLPQGLTPEIMFVVGALLRTATAGAVDMLAARTATKLEVQASVTVISVQDNNPLKFLPNGDVALQQLLSKKMPGFMRADEAMKDAFDDLRAHEIGVIAGTRAALTEVLGRFDPAVLGEKLARGSLLESLLPSVRKNKLWDIYLERYAQIRREAEDDFQSIFGRAFVQAYERETARMKAQKTGSGEQQ